MDRVISLIFKIDMGAKVTDNVTGFKGVVTGRCEYQTGCRQYLVSPKAQKNIPGDARWIDEGRLIANVKTPAGGPQFAPLAK